MAQNTEEGSVACYLVVARHRKKDTEVAAIAASDQLMPVMAQAIGEVSRREMCSMTEIETTIRGPFTLNKVERW